MAPSKLIRRIFFEIAVILSIPSSLLFCILVFVALTIILPYRQLIKLIAPWRLKSAVSIVHPYSQVMGYFNSTKPVNVCRILIMKEKLRVETLQKIFGKISEKEEYSKLKKFVNHFGGYLFWQGEANFDIKHHIRELKSKENLSEEELQEIVSKLLTQVWPKDKSPWEILVINNYGNCGNSVWILRINHILADGFSFLKLVYEFTGGAQTDSTPVTPKNALPRQGVFKRLTLPYRILRDNHKLIRAFGNYGSAWKNLDKDSGYCTSWTQDLLVKDVKGISKRLDTSFEAILTCAISGGLNKFASFLQIDFIKDFVFFKSEPLPNHPGGLRNYFSYAAMKSTVDLEKNVLKRVQWFQKQWLKKKSSTTPQFTYYYGTLGGLLPTFANTSNQKTGTMLFTNFAGPKRKLYIQGNEIINGFSAFGTPTWQTGLTVLAYSWGDKLTIAVTMHKQICHSHGTLNKFLDFVLEEIASMKDYALINEV